MNYDKWYILSAKHGLVEPTRIIQPYDETLKRMPQAERREWAAKVFQQLLPELPDPQNCTLFFHAGAEYRRTLIPMLAARGYDCKVPLDGLAIGEQLSWYLDRT